MTTYYVDSTAGSDGNNGSSGAPWETLGKAKNAIAAGAVGGGVEEVG